MNDELIKTGVDELLDLLRFTSKISVADVAKKLNVSLDVAQAWVDFLVEERIVGIEYKFTTPYIYLNQPLTASSPLEPDNAMNFDISYFKKQFWDKAIKNNIPSNKIDALWKNHLLQELELKKKYFFFEAQNKKVHNIEKLWEEYKGSLIQA